MILLQQHYLTSSVYCHAVNTAIAHDIISYRTEIIISVIIIAPANKIYRLGRRQINLFKLRLEEDARYRYVRYKFYLSIL